MRNMRWRNGIDILDLNDDGVICVDDIIAALRDVAEVSVHEDEQSLAQFVHSRHHAFNARNRVNETKFPPLA